MNIAGDYKEIVNACQRYCERGLCVSVFPCHYAYKFGQEEGAEVRLINYPRFPKHPETIEEQALDLAELSQGSCSIVSANRTWWKTRRDQDA